MTHTTDPTNPPPPDVLHALDLLSRSLGGVDWVQGAGGNASVKHGGHLWVKASGRLFRDTAVAGGHVAVPVELVNRALDDDALDPQVFDRTPRPSMETWFHALPAAVVAHTHPAEVLLVACSARPAPVLDGVKCVDVPYYRPGKELGRELRARWPSNGSATVFLLRGHGLVVCADDAAQAVSISGQYAAACRAMVAGPGAVDAFAESWCALPVHGIEGRVVRELPPRALRPGRRRRDLFPDVVVYAAPWPVETATLPALEVLLALSTDPLPAPRLVEDDRGRRVLVASGREALRRATEIVAVHEWVELALDHAGGGVYLPDDEPRALLAMPSERFRQAAGAGR